MLIAKIYLSNENKTLLKRRLELDLNHIREHYPTGVDDALERRQAEFVRAEARLQTATKELPSDWSSIADRRRRCDRPRPAADHGAPNSPG